MRDGKVVVAISCSIHSTEIVASQMSMNLAYELATAQDEETLEILRNTILLLIPSSNPDGVDIVAKWYRKTLGTPFEGTEPPELYHHYAGHDDNRDWYMLNLKESKAITAFFWQRMVSGDRLRRSPARLERFTFFRAALLRSALSANRAVAAQTGRTDWSQDGRGCNRCRLSRHPDQCALRHLVAWRLSHCSLFS